MNLLDNTPSKFKTKNCVKINDEPQGTYIKNNQIRFETSVLISRLSDYSDAYILVKETITVVINAAQGQSNNTINKRMILKNCAPFTN